MKKLFISALALLLSIPAFGQPISQGVSVRATNGVLRYPMLYNPTSSAPRFQGAVTMDNLPANSGAPSGWLQILPDHTLQTTLNGSTLTNLNADELRAGLVPSARLGFVTIIETNATAAQVQTAINAGGSVWFTPSIYPYLMSTNVWITNGVTIYGNGNTIIPAVGVTNAVWTSGTNTLPAPFYLYAMNFDGLCRSNFGTVSAYFRLLNGTPTLYYNPYWSNYTGLKISSAAGGAIRDCKFTGWAGNGLIVVNANASSASQFRPRIGIFNNEFQTNFCGMFLAGESYETAGYYNNPAPWQLAPAEYQQVIGNRYEGNYAGLAGGAANASVLANNFAGNQIGFHQGAAPNNGGHGIVQNNIFNHNGVGGWAESCQLGQWAGNNFLANTSAGFIGSTITEVQLLNNYFGAATDKVIITNLCTGVVSGNRYQNTWANNGWILTNSLEWCGNRSLTVFGNNDGVTCVGSNATFTGIVSGNGIGLTNMLGLNTNIAAANSISNKLNIDLGGNVTVSGTLIAGSLQSTLGGSATIWDHTSFAGASAGQELFDAFAIAGNKVFGIQSQPNDVQQPTNIFFRVDYPTKQKYGLGSFATNYIANANTAGYTNSRVAPGIGGTNNMVARVVGTSGTLEFYNRSGEYGVTVCGVGVFTNTISSSTWHIPIPVNSGFIIRSGVGVDIQVYAQ